MVDVAVAEERGWEGGRVWRERHGDTACLATQSMTDLQKSRRTSLKHCGIRITIRTSLLPSCVSEFFRAHFCLSRRLATPSYLHMRKTQDSTKGQIFACRKETGVMSSSKSRSSRRRDRDYSSRSPSPQRRRRRRRRSRSSSTEISRSRRHSRSDSDTRKKYTFSPTHLPTYCTYVHSLLRSYRKYSPSDSSEDSDRCHRCDNSSKHGRHRRGNRLSI